jgi:hypothetical protein
MTEKPEPEVKKHQCPFCEYTAKLPSILSRHVNHHHKGITKLTGEARPSTAGDLLDQIKDKETVGDMLIATSEWLAKLTSPMDGKISSDAIEWLKRHDAKTQFALRIIAFVKIKRALDLDTNLQALDKILGEKLKDQKWQANSSPHEIAGMIERIQTQQQKELEFIKEVSQLSTVDMKDIADVLSQAFGNIKMETTNSTVIIPGMPQTPEDREQLRQVLLSCAGQFTGEKK